MKLISPGREFNSLKTVHSSQNGKTNTSYINFA